MADSTVTSCLADRRLGDTFKTFLTKPGGKESGWSRSRAAAYRETETESGVMAVSGARTSCARSAVQSDTTALLRRGAGGGSGADGVVGVVVVAGGELGAGLGVRAGEAVEGEEGEEMLAPGIRRLRAKSVTAMACAQGGTHCVGKGELLKRGACNQEAYRA